MIVVLVPGIGNPLVPVQRTPSSIIEPDPVMETLMVSLSMFPDAPSGKMRPRLPIGLAQPVNSVTRAATAASWVFMRMGVEGWGWRSWGVGI